MYALYKLQNKMLCTVKIVHKPADRIMFPRLSCCKYFEQVSRLLYAADRTLNYFSAEAADFLAVLVKTMPPEAASLDDANILSRYLDCCMQQIKH
jgi:hypothetical protein